MADELYPVPDDLGLGATVRGFSQGQRLFDRYTLKQVLGRGGMGVVWLAHDDVLERDIALKFLPELVTLDKEAISDLKRETRRSLELTHPNIVRIYDFVQDKTWAGISMEYVAGSTLSALKIEQPNNHFEADDLRPWVGQFCDALSYAHSKAKVVHRDLKPANLMINAENDLKIADFGIARSVSDSVSRVTMRAGTSGTLAYMSPEQAMGQTPKVTDDIYAFGATVYELLTSKPPFYRGDLITQIREIAPPSMSGRRAELDVAGQPIPQAWEHTIAACLAKDPAQRPQSIAEVGELLGVRAPSGMTRPPTVTATSVRPPEPPLSSRAELPPPSSGKGLLIVGLAVLLVLLVGAGYYFGVYLPAEQARQAEIAKEEAIEKEKEAEAEAAADAVKKAQLEADAQKAAEAAEALRTQQEKQAEEAAAEKAKQDQAAAAAAAEAERLANARGGLIVKTDPEGATVTMGGADVQTSPATFKDEKLGTYPIHITLDGYEPVDQTAEIKENQFTDLGTITLPHSMGSIQITSTPPDANYTIRNDALGINRSGTCPDTIQTIPVGTYDITLNRDGWAVKGTATVKKGETASYSSEFSYGSVKITSDPSGASVSENGDDLGETPLVLKNLRPGNHTFYLTHSGYSKGSVSAEVIANDTQEVSATLERRLVFAGSWTGTVNAHYTDGSGGPHTIGITIPDDESSLNYTIDNAGPPIVVNSVEKDGDTLTWTMIQNPNNDGVSNWSSTNSLRITSKGTTAQLTVDRTFINGQFKGVTGHETGTMNKQ
jgi:hypothetical protein